MVMKATMRISLSWLGWKGNKSPKSKSDIESDRQLVRELLAEVKSIDAFNPEQPFYDLELDKDDPLLAHLIERLQARPDLVGPGITVMHRFGKFELAEAPLLVWRMTNQAVEDDVYDMEVDGYKGGPAAAYVHCPICRAMLQQRRNLRLRTRRMGARDLSLTFGGDVILSERVRTLFAQHQVTGVAFRPVEADVRPHRPGPQLSQLVATHTLPPMQAPPTEFEGTQQCAECGTTAQFIKHTHMWGVLMYYEPTPIFYYRGVMSDTADINATCERLGEPPVARPYLLISQRLYQLLLQERVKSWDVEPVHIVE